MPSQGPNSGGTFADDATVGSVAWSDPELAATSDTNVATATSGGLFTTHYLLATNFGFSIPAGATIDGIVVGVERKEGSTFEDITDSSIRLYKGSFVGDNKATGTEWPTALTYADYGGAADTWSAGLTAADVNASTFGVGISAVCSVAFGGTASIDHIRITVYYTEAETITGVVLAVTPSLPTGKLNHGLTGVALSATPSLPVGSLKRSLTGVALTVAPSLPAGTVSKGQTLLGVPLVLNPSLPTGSVTTVVTGVALTLHPTLPIGAAHPFRVGGGLEGFEVAGGSMGYGRNRRRKNFATGQGRSV